jgi:hypothetical protein
MPAQDVHGAKAAPDRPAHVPPEWLRHPDTRPFGGAYPYYLAPWGWYVPQTYKHKYYPPPVAIEPRLGLMHNYPYAWQMGLQLPVDAEPLQTYSLGPFEGVVRSPQRPVWLHEVAGDAAEAVALMRQGRFQDAGRLLAKPFRETSDPRYPLLLAEVLCAMGKHNHADLVLRHALGLEGAFDALPEDAAAHFASADAFEKAAEAVPQDSVPLLKGYMLLFTRDGGRGLDLLLRMSQGETADKELAAKLYRHYLGKAFGKPEAEGGAAEPKKGADGKS